MKATQDLSAFRINETLEIIVSASLAVNVSLICSIFLPWISQFMRRKLLKVSENEVASRTGNDQAYINRMTSSLFFYVVFPVCGLVLLFTSEVLRSPFFAFDRSLRIVFSTALGHYMYKSAESLYWHTQTNYQPVLVHHAVVIAIYTVILSYEQCAVIGVVGLLLKGCFVFVEFENKMLPRVVFRQRECSPCMKIMLVAMFVSGVVLKGLVPGLLVMFSVATSSSDLLKMQHIPLAFFFLSVVFFSAVAGWFFKDAFRCLIEIFKQSKSQLVYDIQHRPWNTAINHSGLGRLVETNGTGILHIKCNDLWDRELPSLCSAHALGDKPINIDIVEVECATPAVLKSTNILT